MRRGLELWNRPDGGTADEWARLAALGADVVKLRGYHGTEVLSRCLTISPQVGYIVRPNADEPIDVVRWMHELEEVLDWLTAWGCWFVVELDSEPNHQDHPNRQGTVAEYAEQLEIWATVLRARWPGVRLSAPALAVMQDDLAWQEALEPLYRRLAIPYRSAHLYWQGDNQASPDWGRRLERLGAISGPARWIVSEVGDASEVAEPHDRARRILDVLRWLQGRGDVEAAVLFIAGSDDPRWARFVLPPAELAFIRGDVMHHVGVGFQRAEALIGPWREDEVYHAPGTEHETSMAIGDRGYATWRRLTNETVVHVDDGSLYSDHGNQGQGILERVYPL